MKLLRTLRLDQSDSEVFPLAAEAGEWAVTGSFAFGQLNPQELAGKDRQAFANGWLGLESFGRATLVEVAEVTEAEQARLVERLARHFMETYGAPGLAEALPVAKAELDDAASLCEHKLHTLLTIERFQDEETGELRERVRVVEPHRAPDHARIW
ncbi:DUF6505 family protein [Rhodovibrionaceae bacterium A322]